MTTLLDNLGGEPALRAAVDEFYARLIVDPELEPFFVDVNVERLKKHQYIFMSTAFTKIPEDMDVAGLISTKHARLFEMGLNERHFDIVAGHFVGTLQSLNVDPALIDEAAGVILPLRPVFVDCASKVKARKMVKAPKMKKMVTISVGVVAVIACLAAVAYK